MQVEARFTIKNTENEIPFSIAEGQTTDELILYSISDDSEYKFPLLVEDQQLKLNVNNPFEENEEIISERLTGLYADWIESRSQGFENDDSAAITIYPIPGYGPDDIFVENKPFSLKQLVDLIASDDIELAPGFQRNFVWDKTRQSRLIESILLGLPLPSIYLSQYDDGRLTIVDGLQRLTTIKKFLADELKLSNLEYLKDCNGKKYSQLDGVLSKLRLRRFGQTQIMCFVIDYRSPSKLKFDLFRRLNTGGKPLNNQEIRNCLARPFVQTVLKQMVELDNFKLATGGSVRDTRMDAREAALRFIYFYEQYSTDKTTGNYNGDMENALDEFIDELNKRNVNQIEKYILLYDQALSSAYHLFGRYSFRKIIPGTLNRRRPPVNNLLLLTLTVLLTNYNTNAIVSDYNYEYLVEFIAEFIFEVDGLFEALTYGTNGKYNIEFSFKAFSQFLNEHLIRI
jgi:hypothetical protein